MYYLTATEANLFIRTLLYTSHKVIHYHLYTELYTSLGFEKERVYLSIKPVNIKYMYLHKSYNYILWSIPLTKTARKSFAYFISKVNRARRSIPEGGTWQD